MHIAIIPDGNGRWAEKQNKARYHGHQRGADVLESIIQHAIAHPDIDTLTVFAFSTQNNARPKREVNLLMRLFDQKLQEFINIADEHAVDFHFIGDHSLYSQKTQQLIAKLASIQHHSPKLTLNIAIHYSGRWDITHAVNQLVQKKLKQQDTSPISESDVSQALSLSHGAEPDLLIRTGGEHRISNFLLWQFAYTELYFLDMMWPDFNTQTFDDALVHFTKCQRRFGVLPK